MDNLLYYSVLYGRNRLVDRSIIGGQNGATQRSSLTKMIETVTEAPVAQLDRALPSEGMSLHALSSKINANRSGMPIIVANRFTRIRGKKGHSWDNSQITAEELRSVLHYNPKTGLFKRLIRRCRFEA